MASSEDNFEGLDEKTLNAFLKYIVNITTGKIQNSEKTALATVDLLEYIINETEYEDAMALCELVRLVGRYIGRALPRELVAPNIVRRVLRAIRDEHKAQTNKVDEEDTGESLQRLVLAAPGPLHTIGVPTTDVRGPIRNFMAEIRIELETSLSAICSQVEEHVHSGEIVLTYGASPLVEKFLMSSKDKDFEVVAAESTEITESHEMALRLADAGIKVTVVTTAAISALMPKVNKVIVEAVSGLAGGSAVTNIGTYIPTINAQFFSVEVIVLCPMFSLSPLHTYDTDQFSNLASPTQALLYEDAVSSKVQVEAFVYDVVPHEHITLFITNLGVSTPAHLHRFVSELYDPDDYQLTDL